MKSYKKNGRLWILQAEQNSEIWLKEKAGVLSSSSSTFKLTKAGEPTSEAKKLVATKASERLLGKIHQISAKVLEYGHEKEPIAIRKYELRTGKKVQRLGFARMVEHDYIGDSPDALINYDEKTGKAEIVVEVKSHVSPFEFGNAVLSKHPDFSKYLEQILHHFLVFDAKEVHHISYSERSDGEMLIFVSILKRDDFADKITEHFEQCKIAEKEIQATHQVMKDNLDNNQLIF